MVELGVKFRHFVLLLILFDTVPFNGGLRPSDKLFRGTLLPKSRK